MRWITKRNRHVRELERQLEKLQTEIISGNNRYCRDYLDEAESIFAAKDAAYAKQAATIERLERVLAILKRRDPVIVLCAMQIAAREAIDKFIAKGQVTCEDGS